MDFCDTHGLDFPCKACINERHEERKYLDSIEHALRRSEREVGKDED